MSFLAYGLCFLCSAFVGGGYSPVFSVMAESRRRKSDLNGMASFFGAKAAYDLCSGVLPFTAPHYLAYALAYLASRWGSVAASFCFYLVSNSICFFQMLGSFYPPTFAGYASCMWAGVPFLLRSIVGCLAMDLAFFLLARIEHSDSKAGILLPASSEGLA